jgi:hypothetical protein
MSQSGSKSKQLEFALRVRPTNNLNTLSRLMSEHPTSKSERKEKRGKIGSAFHKLGKSLGMTNRRHNNVYQEQLIEAHEYLSRPNTEQHIRRHTGEHSAQVLGVIMDALQERIDEVRQQNEVRKLKARLQRLKQSGGKKSLTKKTKKSTKKRTTKKRTTKK